MRSRREPAHIDADLGDDGLCAEVLDARNRHYEVDCGAKGPQVRLHLRVDRGHGGIESVDLQAAKRRRHHLTCDVGLVAFGRESVVMTSDDKSVTIMS
jgi:hypothetical protein